jgi:hypothetical protein
MAIINTLEKCLESPYLFPDDQAPSRVAALLQLSTDRLEAAVAISRSDKPDPADIGTLAYEAMFASLRALVYAKGYREAGLKCLLLACEQFYVRPGLLDAGHLQAFEQVQAHKAKPSEAVRASEAFVLKARELVGG